MSINEDYHVARRVCAWQAVVVNWSVNTVRIIAGNPPSEHIAS